MTSSASRTIHRATPMLDAWRRSAGAPSTPEQTHKEWLHFSIHAGRAHALFNVSAMERPGCPTSFTTWRTALLVHADGDWTGVVRDCPAQAVEQDDAVGIRTPEATVSWVEGAFVIRARLGDVELDARVQPQVAPTSASTVSLGKNQALSWIVVPRARARGSLRFGGRSMPFRDAPAYHDHNWGQFAWGSDLTWDWGHVVSDTPENPWTLVFCRVSSGDRSRTLSQGALIWRQKANVRTFENRELAITPHGIFQPHSLATMPHLPGLLARGTASGIPARLVIETRVGRHEHLRLDYRPTAACRVAIPADRHPTRMTLLNETLGQAQVRGVVAGKPLDFEAPAIVEFVRGQTG